MAINRSLEIDKLERESYLKRDDAIKLANLYKEKNKELEDRIRDDYGINIIKDQFNGFLDFLTRVNKEKTEEEQSNLNNLIANLNVINSQLLSLNQYTSKLPNTENVLVLYETACNEIYEVSSALKLNFENKYNNLSSLISDVKTFKTYLSDVEFKSEEELIFPSEIKSKPKHKYKLKPKEEVVEEISGEPSGITLDEPLFDFLSDDEIYDPTSYIEDFEENTDLFPERKKISKNQDSLEDLTF